MKVILVQEARQYLIALEYNDVLFNVLPSEKKQELLTSKRRIVTRKITKEQPFTGQLIATEFQDHFIKSNFRIFKGSQIDCINFMKFYIEKGEFKPEHYIFINKYSNVLKFKAQEDFEKAVI